MLKVLGGEEEEVLLRWEAICDSLVFGEVVRRGVMLRSMKCERKGIKKALKIIVQRKVVSRFEFIVKERSTRPSAKSGLCSPFPR